MRCALLLTELLERGGVPTFGFECVRVNPHHDCFFLGGGQGIGTMGFSKVGIACVAADLGFSRRFALEPLPTLTRAPFKAAERQLAVRPTVSASVLAGPALEVVRVCMYYTLMQTGVAVQSAKLKGEYLSADSILTASIS